MYVYFLLVVPLFSDAEECKMRPSDGPYCFPRQSNPLSRFCDFPLRIKPFSFVTYARVPSDRRVIASSNNKYHSYNGHKPSTCSIEVGILAPPQRTVAITMAYSLRNVTDKKANDLITWRSFVVAAKWTSFSMYFRLPLYTVWCSFLAYCINYYLLCPGNLYFFLDLLFLFP